MTATYSKGVHQDGMLELRAPLPNDYAARTIWIQVEAKKPASAINAGRSDKELK
jgi:hypothetical protein